jgi:hypothetical protein
MLSWIRSKPLTSKHQLHFLLIKLIKPVFISLRTELASPQFEFVARYVLAVTSLDAFPTHCTFQTKLTNIFSATFPIIFWCILVFQKWTNVKTALHSPQEARTFSPWISGTLVITDANLKAQLNFSFTVSSFLPRHLSPAFSAITLWEMVIP